MKTRHSVLLTAAAVSCSLITLNIAGAEAVPEYDLVIANGRVIDPESALDATRHVGIVDGKVVVVSEEPLDGAEEVDATGLVVAPGFIDLHSHALNIPSAWMQVFDGVTTTLELERGAWPLEQAYDNVAENGLPLNYGFAVSWIDVRMEILGEKFDQRVTSDISEQVIERIEDGLKQGGIGIGLLPGYVPNTNRVEYYEAAKLAARYNVPTFTHVRGKFHDEPGHAIEGYGEVLAAAAATGAQMHICHLSSSATRFIPEVSRMILKAQEQGLRVTTETYPYGAGSTVISAPFLRARELQRVGLEHDSIVYLKTGERPESDERLTEIQETDPMGLSIIHYLDEGIEEDATLIDKAVIFPDGIIASDAMPFTVDGEEVLDPVWPLPEEAISHPRSVGTFARVLGRYVRERQLMSLSEAIRRSSLLPARLLEDSVPDMKNKGRIREGADADIVVFDPETIIDRATFEDPRQHSAGVRHLIVGGGFVVRDGELDQTARPGRPVRATAH